jgi:antitoxin component of MazEF toxin-antitoxin module
MSVITHVKKYGNSLALHMPKTFAEAHHIDSDTRFRMEYENGRIVIEPLSIDDGQEEHDRIYNLLVADLTPETADLDLARGGPVGQELL